MVGLNLSDLEISQMNRRKFKNLVKEKTKQAAFKYLLSVKGKHSKMKGLSYTKFEKQEYLNSPLFNSESLKLLLALRTRTVNEIKNDFRGQYSDIKCPLRCGEDDLITHILDCNVLKLHHTSSAVTSEQIKYQDAFCSNIEKQQQVTELYQQLLEVRSRLLLSSQPEAVTGPLHSFAKVQLDYRIIL